MLEEDLRLCLESACDVVVLAVNVKLVKFEKLSNGTVKKAEYLTRNEPRCFLPIAKIILGNDSPFKW